MRIRWLRPRHATRTVSRIVLIAPPTANGSAAPVYNTLIVTSGVTVQGGGLFTTAPVTMTNSMITQNAPDQSFGC